MSDRSSDIDSNLSQESSQGSSQESSQGSSQGSSQESSQGSSQDSSQGISSKGGIRKAGGIIIGEGSKLAMIRGRQSGKWGVPKGTLDDSDLTILDGALREIYEETGLKLKVREGQSVDYWMVYKCRLYNFNLQGCPVLRPQDNFEIMESRWLDLRKKFEVDEIYEKSTKMMKYVLRRLRREMQLSS